jgi:hypothetical protein
VEVSGTNESDWMLGWFVKPMREREKFHIRSVSVGFVEPMRRQKKAEDSDLCFRSSFILLLGVTRERSDGV